MAKINGVCVGESLVGEGNEVAHIDLLIGPRGSPVEAAFCNALTNNKDGFTSLLAVVAPNLITKPATVMFNKVTIKGAKQAVQMFGPAQRAVAMAVADSVAEGVIPAEEADNLFICVGVFIHWQAADDKKIQDYNYKGGQGVDRARHQGRAEVCGGHCETRFHGSSVPGTQITLVPRPAPLSRSGLNFFKLKKFFPQIPYVCSASEYPFREQRKATTAGNRKRKIFIVIRCSLFICSD